MTGPALRVYLALSLDGFVADADGGTGFLEPFQAVDYGYPQFFAGIGLVVMGRRTFDQVHGFGDWPYAAARTLVLSHRPLPEDAPPDVVRAGGDLARLVAALRASGGKDVWIQGGALTIRSFLEADAIDRLDLFIMPLRLGMGVPLFEGGLARRLTLVGHETYPTGAVRLAYTRG